MRELWLCGLVALGVTAIIAVTVALAQWRREGCPRDAWDEWDWGA